MIRILARSQIVKLHLDWNFNSIRISINKAVSFYPVGCLIELDDEELFIFYYIYYGFFS